MEKVTICFIDSNGNQMWEDTIDREAWMKQHTNVTVTHIFKCAGDTQAYEQNIEAQFIGYCINYGFTKDMLHKQFVDNKGEEFELLGYKPGNRKYKFIIHNKTQNKRFKVSYEYIKQAVMKP